MSSGWGPPVLTPKLMPVVVLDQIAVQNTWYTVLDEKNIEVYTAIINMQTAGETVAMRLTIDGVAYTNTQAAVAGTDYYGLINTYVDSLAYTTVVSALLQPNGSLKCRSFKMEVRKTTANAANHLMAWCRYSKW